MRIKVLFNGPAKKLNHESNMAEIELPEGSTGYDLCACFDIIPGKSRYYSFLIRNGKKMKEAELLHDGDTIRVNGRMSGG